MCQHRQVEVNVKPKGSYMYLWAQVDYIYCDGPIFNEILLRPLSATHMLSSEPRGMS